MNISFEEFSKLRMRIGLIVEAEKVEGTDKLLKLQVDFGPSASFNSAQDKGSGQVTVLLHPDRKVPAGSMLT